MNERPFSGVNGHSLADLVIAISRGEGVYLARQTGCCGFVGLGHRLGGGMVSVTSHVVALSSGQAARRGQILDAAEACFVRNGFHRTSMQDLAREAGMTASNFYRYFPSKEALIQGLVERERERGAMLVQQMECAGDKRGALLAILTTYFTSLDRTSAVLRVDIWSEATRNPAIAELTDQTESEARIWFTQTFAAIATSSDCDPVALYDVLGPVMKGIVVSRALFADYDPATGAAQLHALLDAGLDGRLPNAFRAPSEPSR